MHHGLYYLNAGICINIDALLFWAPVEPSQISLFRNDSRQDGADRYKERNNNKNVRVKIEHGPSSPEEYVAIATI